MASAYSIAKTKVDQYFVNNQKGYSSPKYVAKLPPREKIGGGKIVTIDEVFN